MLEYTRHSKVSLRNHPDFDEVWLQDRIAQDPGILGLGDLDLVDRERIQSTAGRLDLLLSDSRTDSRYEVEIMLGSTDPSHIVRCIEYWDLERRRYPAYDHTAVLIAEDITARFLNVVGLFSGSIPIIAIQLNALQVDDRIVLDFVHVLNQTQLRQDDTVDAGGDEVDRAYWDARVGKDIMAICDQVFALVNDGSKREWRANYKKNHIGMTDGAARRNFIHLAPRKNFVQIRALVQDGKKWLEEFEEAGLDVTIRKRGDLQVTARPGEVDDHLERIGRLLNEATLEFES